MTISSRQLEEAKPCSRIHDLSILSFIDSMLGQNYVGTLWIRPANTGESG